MFKFSLLIALVFGLSACGEADTDPVVGWTVHEDGLRFRAPERGAEPIDDVVAELPDAEGACKTCTGICQTIVWVNGGSIYTEVDVGGGQSPSDCVDDVAEACGGAYATFMSSATCGN